MSSDQACRRRETGRANTGGNHGRCSSLRTAGPIRSSLASVGARSTSGRPGVLWRSRWRCRSSSRAVRRCVARCSWGHLRPTAGPEHALGLEPVVLPSPMRRGRAPRSTNGRYPSVIGSFVPSRSMGQPNAAPSAPARRRWRGATGPRLIGRSGVGRCWSLPLPSSASPWPRRPVVALAQGQRRQAQHDYDCGAVRHGGRDGPSNGRFVRYAACLRSHGVLNFPDDPASPVIRALKQSGGCPRRSSSPPHEPVRSTPTMGHRPPRSPLMTRPTT